MFDFVCLFVCLFFLQLELPVSCAPGGGGTPLCGTERVCVAQQGMVFRDLLLKQVIQFHYLTS